MPRTASAEGRGVHGRPLFLPDRVGRHVADQGQVADLVDQVGNRAFEICHREAPENHNVTGIQLAPAVDNVGSLRLASLASDQTARDWIEIAAFMNSGRGRPPQLAEYPPAPTRAPWVQSTSRQRADHPEEQPAHPEPVRAVSETLKSPISFPM